MESEGHGKSETDGEIEHKRTRENGGKTRGIKNGLQDVGCLLLGSWDGRKKQRIGVR